MVRVKKITSVVLVVSLVVVLVGCATHVHQIGSGAQGSDVTEARQWYALWGLIPINEVDTAQMAGSAQDYTIKTEVSPLDVLFNIFTTYVTINSRTVTVTK